MFHVSEPDQLKHVLKSQLQKDNLLFLRELSLDVLGDPYTCVEENHKLHIVTYLFVGVGSLVSRGLLRLLALLTC
jgi:hypothetical protein